MNLGIWEIAALAIVALIFFGPSRLPALGKSVGEAIRGFKKGIEGLDEPPADKKSTSSQAPRHETSQAIHESSASEVSYSDTAVKKEPVGSNDGSNRN